MPLPPDLPHDHPDFIAAWAEAARTGKAPEVDRPAAGTLASTWAAALSSDTLAGRSPSYRGIIERHARQITERAGTVKAAAIRAKHVRADLAQARDPNGRHRAWRFWGRYCVQRGWLDDDPTHGVSIPTRAKPKGKHGHPTWSRDEIEAFRAAYPIGTTARAIMELTYWTGARISDVVKLGRQHIDADGVLCFRQTKTGDNAYVPWSCGLPTYAAGMQADRDLCREAIAHMGGGMTFLQTARGTARSHKSAGQDISAACRAIGIERSAHGLRKARAVSLADAGATVTQIAAWTGHRSLSEVAHYTAENDRRGAVRGTGTEQERGTSDPVGPLFGKKAKES